MITLKEVKKAQEIIDNAIIELQKELKKSIADSQPMKGVKIIGKNCIRISSSTLMKNNWSPSTYVPESQIEAVISYVSNVKTFSELIKKIEELLNTKCVKKGNEIITLNSATLSAISTVYEKVIA